jgi:hypothetical protein
MKSLAARRIFGAFILCSFITLPCYSQRADYNRGLNKRKRIIVEIAVKEFGGFQRLELLLAQGAGRGGGGGTSAPVNISGYNFGLSILELRKRDALLSLTMTLNFVDGTEKKIDERFLVMRGEKKEYQFAFGVKIKCYFKGKRGGRKDGRFKPAASKRSLEGRVTAESPKANGH